MKRPGGGAGFKVFVWTAFALCCFLGAGLFLKVLPFLAFDGDEAAQDTRQYRWLIWQRAHQVSEGYALGRELNSGKLSYAQTQETKDRIETLEKGLMPDATNFRFRVLDQAGVEAVTNLPDGEKLSAPVFYYDFRMGEYGLSEDVWGNELWDERAEGTPEPDAQIEGEAEPEPAVYTIACSVLAEEELLTSEVEDEFYRYTWWFLVGLGDRVAAGVIAAVLLCAALVFLGLILWSAGRKNGEEGFVLTWQEKIPFDVYVFLAACVLCWTVWAAVELAEQLVNLSLWSLWGADETEQRNLLVMGSAAFCTLTALGAALTLRTLTARCKCRALARSTLLCRALMWSWRTFKEVCKAAAELARSIPFLWKEMIGFFLYFFLDLFLFVGGRNSALAGLMWFLLNGAVLLLICWWGLGFHKIRKGGHAIAGGDMEYQIDTHRMPDDLRRHAEDLNNLSEGLSSAVEAKMKSERFKAELITNVSHDLKTPLTSIINYVGLLKGTEQTDPKAVEYIEVLDRKSQRLKKLTEDLVEASKASTGVLAVNREKIGLGQLLDQALGEWREKLEEKRLTLVTTLPEGETWVYADGRHLWRVVDNLLSNCAKYALEGTRIYLDLSRGKGQVALSVKNISREALNVPPERLLERFVRGEESRTTEGSGLGLSIARSLTELQGGAFELAVDGDLFKAIVTLPQAN